MCACACMLVYVCEWAYATECMWWSEGTLLESVLAFRHVDLRDQAQTGRLGSKPPYPLNHVTCPGSMIRAHIFST